MDKAEVTWPMSATEVLIREALSPNHEAFVRLEANGIVMLDGRFSASELEAIARVLRRQEIKP